MNTNKPGRNGFKRQVVFRISADEWPLLEAAAQEHGSIQDAILAGLHALARARAASSPRKVTQREAPQPPRGPAKTAPPAQATPEPASEDPNEELRARHAAAILGLKASTVAGYIRSGRLSGHYDDTPGSCGWVTTRGAVEDYRERIR